MHITFTRRFLRDTAERTLVTFVQGFLVAWTLVGDTNADLLFTWVNVKGGLIGGALALGKALLASFRGHRDSASLARGV